MIPFRSKVPYIHTDTSNALITENYCHILAKCQCRKDLSNPAPPAVQSEFSWPVSCTVLNWTRLYSVFLVIRDVLRCLYVCACAITFVWCNNTNTSCYDGLFRCVGASILTARRWGSSLLQLQWQARPYSHTAEHSLSNKHTHIKYIPLKLQ
jgi:hypothetical protein